MKLTHCNIAYQTQAFDDSNLGCAGLELFSTDMERTTLIGKITFWDASGQFSIKLAAGEVPLEIVEKFISEAKQAIKTA